MIRRMNLSLQEALRRDKRDKTIVKLARTMSLADIGRLHGLTRERVRQIVLAATKKSS